MDTDFEYWDNAVAESFFSKLKNERLRWLRFATRRHATREIGDRNSGLTKKGRGTDSETRGAP